MVSPKNLPPRPCFPPAISFSRPIPTLFTGLDSALPESKLIRTTERQTRPFSVQFNAEEIMNRRDFAKGLAALPFAATINSFTSSGRTEQSQEVSRAEYRALEKRNALAGSFEKFEIVLNGPFALVMSQDAPDKLRAFTPLESHDLHTFFINNASAKETKKRHVVSLVTEQGALKENRTLPKIDPLLADFNWHSPEKEITSVQNL